MSRFDTWDTERERQIAERLRRVAAGELLTLPSALVESEVPPDNVVPITVARGRKRRVSRYVPTMPSGGAA